MKRTLLLDIISCLFIILFLYTGVWKLLDQDTFRAALKKLPVIMHYEAAIAIFIPMLEVLIAVSLLGAMLKDNKALRKWGLTGSFVLMTLFTLYVGYMLAKYTNRLPCSCGGMMRQMNWHQHFYFNTAFTLLALMGLMLNKKMRQSAGNMSFTV
jgi:hypothetical protein